MKQTTDMIPITPVSWPPASFKVVNIDLIVPINPPTSRGHKYVLIDQCTRVMAAIPIKKADARSTCDVLPVIWTTLGIRKVVVSDHDSSFDTTEFQKMIGYLPKFSTPYLPRRNRLIEKFNEVPKNMLRHVIYDDGRGWDHQLPFILWA